MYAKKLSDGTWEKLNGNVVFSPTVYQTAESLTEEQRAEFDVHYITQTLKPEVDHTFDVTEADPELVDGKWTQVWVVSDASAEDVKRRTEEKAASVRAERNKLLSDCDWTQIADSTADKVSWATYRQELRDLTKQDGFPHNVVWPQHPSSNGS